MASKKYKAESKRIKNKRIALKLILIFALVVSLYFGFIKNGFIIIQNIYIFTAFLCALAFVALSAYIGYNKNSSEKENSNNTKIASAAVVCRYLLIIIFSTVVSLLLDYMLIILGWADSFGI